MDREMDNLDSLDDEEKRPKSQYEIEVEEYEKMDPALKCPARLLEILSYQTSLPPPSIHVRYMKFCEVSGDGFIGRNVLVDLCKKQNPNAMDKDLEMYAKMIIWMTASIQSQWKKSFVGFREATLAVEWFIKERKNAYDLLRWLFRFYDSKGRGEILLSELPKLVSFSVQLCGIQETEEGSDTRYFKQLSICSKT